MGDFPDYFRIGAWPSTQAYNWLKNQAGLTEADMYDFLSYFDTKNMAEHVKSHVITAVGLQDETCPPHTNMAPFNVVSKNGKYDTELKVNQSLSHATHPEWNNERNAFFAKLRKTTTSAVGSFIPETGVSVRTEGLSVIIEGTLNGVVNIYGADGRMTYRGMSHRILLPIHGLYIMNVSGAIYKFSL